MKDALHTPTRKGTRLAKIGIWTGLIGVLAIGASGLVGRIGMSPFVGMGAYALGGLLMLIAVITAGLGLIRSSGTAGNASRGATWAALLAGLVVTANNGMVMRQAGGPIHDISTDLDNPPAFVAIIPLRAGAPNPPEYDGADTAAKQRSIYPDIQPLVTDAPPAAVFAAAQAVVADKGWTLAGASAADGRIEATAETSWVRFKDDVVIRIAPDNGQTRVDVRSKSRVGRGDMGANARRIRDFLKSLQARLGNQPG